ncbi:MAG: S-layer homology domain-containing protein [Candidatus Ornithomonoglobus sp.]
MSKFIALLCAAAMTVSAGATLAFAADETTAETTEAAATEEATAEAEATEAATEEAAAEAETTEAATEEAAAEAEATEAATEEATAEAEATEAATEEATADPEATEAATEEPTAAPTETPAVNPFEDCQDEWFTDAVTYVYNNGLIKGYDEVTFGPQDNVTRDQLAVILYRLNSTEEVVTEGENWAAGAEAWVSETGIMDEFLGEDFNGSENLTREQIISTIYKAYKLSNEAADTSAQELSAFVDSESITDYAVEAVKWAVASGIVEGNDDMEINPADNVTRAETSAILQRYLTKLTFADTAEEPAVTEEPEATEEPAAEATEAPEATEEPAAEATEAPEATEEPASEETTEEPEEEEATEEPVEEVAE